MCMLRKGCGVTRIAEGNGPVRTPAHGVTFKAPTVSIEEGDTILGIKSRTRSRRPKFIRLDPGEHNLLFIAARPRSGSSFDRRFLFEEGDILVVICHPIQPWTIFGRSPEADTWYMDVVLLGDIGWPPATARDIFHDRGQFGPNTRLSHNSRLRSVERLAPLPVPGPGPLRPVPAGRIVVRPGAGQRGDYGLCGTSGTR
jgi:hypothetical protein